MTEQATTTTYVAYQIPGVLYSEETVEKVDVRNPQQAAKSAPNNAFAFFYYDVVKTVVDVEGKRIGTASSRLNISKTYYIDAELLTDDQVAALAGDNDILLGNIRGGGIVRCRGGNFRPFEADKHELVTTS